MCYAKPGPRCAPHAREDFGKAVSALQEYAETGIGDAIALSATLKTARTDYYGTDEGKQSALDKAERFEVQGRKDKADLIRGHVDEAVAHRAMRMKMYEQVQANKTNADQATQQYLGSDEGRGLSSSSKGKEVGYPRPRARLSNHVDDTEELPIPWIATTSEGTLTESGWTGFEGTKALRAHKDRLCQVCGNKVIGKMVHLNTKKMPSGHPSTVQGMETSGSGMHAKCALVALKHCPHYSRDVLGDTKSFNDDTPIGFGWNAGGQGYVSMLDSNKQEVDDRISGKGNHSGSTDIESDYVNARADAQILTIGDIKKLAKEESADARAQQSRTTAA